MAGELARAKREKSLAEFLLIISLVLILMASFVYYFFKQESEYGQTVFARIANNFAERVVLSHSQWLIEANPVFVELPAYDRDNQRQSLVIEMNKYGWLDTKQPNACAAIWQAATDMTIEDFIEPLAAVEIQINQQGGRICRYSLASGIYFDYNSQTGAVSAVKSH